MSRNRPAKPRGQKKVKTVQGRLPSKGAERNILQIADKVMVKVEAEATKRRERRDAAAAAAKISVSYRKAIVTFIDVLGFRQLITTRTADEMARIIRFFYYIGDAEDDSAAEGEAGLRVLAFSDSIVRVRDATFPSAFFYELLSLVHMQGELAAKGVAIRGAVTHGDVYVDQSTVLGPALVRAYELESSNAVYPRIVVDPALLQFFEDGKFGPAHHDHSWESGYVQELLDRAEDGFWFVDYLRAFADELDAPEKYLEYLAEHAKWIASSKTAAGKDLALAAKFHWLASYHDRVVEELHDDQVAAHASTKVALRAVGAAPFSFRMPVRHEIRDDEYWKRVSGPKQSPKADHES